MIPREVALVKRLENEPFALIGINTDYALPQMKESMSRSGVTWRNVWEGQVKPGRGALSKAWNVRGYPTVYVIDAQGVIRYIDHGESLERIVDEQLAALKRASTNR
jgi:hypothetical protein